MVANSTNSKMRSAQRHRFIGSPEKQLRHRLCDLPLAVKAIWALGTLKHHYLGFLASC